MSGTDDNFLARWSRRKETVKAAEAPAAVETELPAETAAHDSEEAALLHRPEDAEPNAEEVREPLPRIEDLTADSDLSAFMRKGVPQALKAEAMRRMWSIDPFIRDFTGLAEYSWDYNTPGAIPGFGPIVDSASTRDMLASLAGRSSAPGEPNPAGPQAEDAETAALDSEAGATADSAEPSQAEAVHSPPAPPPSDRENEDAGLAANEAEAAADAAPASQPMRRARSPHAEPARALPARHGRAIPR